MQAILITTLAECPGLLAAAFLIDSKGRRPTLQAGMLCCAVALASMIADPPQAGQLVLLFVARACIEGTFCVLYVYSPEVSVADGWVSGWLLRVVAYCSCV